MSLSLCDHNRQECTGVRPLRGIQSRAHPPRSSRWSVRAPIGAKKCGRRLTNGTRHVFILEICSAIGGPTAPARDRIKECNARSSGLPSSCWG